jgi:hypothetical protein
VWRCSSRCTLSTFLDLASWSTPRTPLAQLTMRGFSARDGASGLLLEKRRRGAPYLGHRCTPPRARSSIEWASQPSAPGASWHAPILALDRSSTCGGGAPNSPQTLAYLHRRGAFAGRPSTAHARAIAELPFAPHVQSTNGHRGGFVGGLSVRPACAAGGSEHAPPSDDREYLTLGIPELKTRGRISNARALGGMACQSLAATV